MRIAFQANVSAEMRDGAVLRADVYRPDAHGANPVLLCRTPYDKASERNAHKARQMAARGYTVVVQDIRGRYASEGDFVWQFQDNSETFDAEDGYDTVEWAASLPGSDGQVGAWGHSYAAWCGWRLAATRDQSPLDGRADILVYATPALTSPVEVIGPVELRLWVASTAPDTDFAAKLIDVHPDGLAVNLSYGITRATYREGYESPKLMDPCTAYELTVRLHPTGVRFGVGHRIRLDVSSSDFPNFDRHHNTAADFWSDDELRVARQTVFHDRAHPSRLILPVVP